MQGYGLPTTWRGIKIVLPCSSLYSDMPVKNARSPSRWLDLTGSEVAVSGLGQADAVGIERCC